MRWVVLPRATAYESRSANHVQLMVAPPPMVPAPQRPDNGEPDPEANHQATDEIRWHRQHKRWIVRPRPASIDKHGIVVGYIDHVRLGRLDRDALILIRNGLLRRRVQRAGGSGPLPQTLNGVHDVALLSQKGVTDLLGPLKVMVHHLQDRWKRHH